MARYTVYLFDNRGRVDEGVDVDYADDTQAVTSVRRYLAEGAVAEIWCGSRHIGRILGEQDGWSVRRQIGEQTFP
jgi:hypothetical protein